MDVSFLIFVGVMALTFVVAMIRANAKTSKSGESRPSRDEEERLKAQRENVIKNLKSEKDRRAGRANRTGLTGMSAKTVSTLKSSTHVHPSDTDGHETVDPYHGSIGDVSNEGCDEHAYIRFLTPTVTEDDESANEKLADIGKSIVLGEILAHPKFRRR